MPKITIDSTKGLVQKTGNTDVVLDSDEKLYGHKKKVEAITAAKTLTLADSGKIFTIDADGGAYAITLPTATTTAGANDLLGWNALFINTDIADTNVDITIVRGDTSNDALAGPVAPADGSAAAGLTIGSNVITFAADGGDAVGDMVEVMCYSASSSATKYICRAIAAS
jgi:hypothetical protein